MENAEILKLVEAGFTAEEIRKMGAEKAPEESKTKETGNEQSAPDQTRESKVNDSDDVLQTLTQTVSELSQTVKALQDANINKAKGTEQPKTVDKVKEVMDSFIKEL